MNPVFVILVLIGAVILWFGINSLFPIIGAFVCGLFEETKDNITRKDEE
jgi:hypothetical protein